MSRHGEWWKSRLLAEKARASMRDRWSTRRHFVMIMPNGETVKLGTVEEVAHAVGKRPATVKQYLFLGGGKYKFAFDDDVVEVRRIYPRRAKSEE